MAMMHDSTYKKVILILLGLLVLIGGSNFFHKKSSNDSVPTMPRAVHKKNTFESSHVGEILLKNATTTIDPIKLAAAHLHEYLPNDDTAIDMLVATYYDLTLPGGSADASIFSEAGTDLYGFFLPYIGDIQDMRIKEGGQPEYEAFRRAFVASDSPAAAFRFPYRTGNSYGGRLAGKKLLADGTMLAYGAYGWSAYGGPPAKLCKESGINIDRFIFKKINNEWKIEEIDDFIDQWVTNNEGATEEECREINQDKILKYQI